jgi:hypothetical protein
MDLGDEWTQLAKLHIIEEFLRSFDEEQRTACDTSYPAKCGYVSVVVNCEGHVRPQQVHPIVTLPRSITCWRQQ